MSVAANRKAVVRLSCAILVVCCTPHLAGVSKKDFLRHYQGMPYRDSRYLGGPQEIPGKVECAYYDLGGEGIAYHDFDTRTMAVAFSIRRTEAT